MGRRAVLTGHWLSDGEVYEEGYVGQIVAEWPSGAEWLATRDVAERVVLRQQQLRAQSLNPEDLTDLRFDGHTLVVTSYGHVERCAPQDDGRYLIAFGLVWNAADPADVYLVYGAPELTDRFAGPLTVLGRAAARLRRHAVRVPDRAGRPRRRNACEPPAPRPRRASRRR